MKLEQVQKAIIHLGYTPTVQVDEFTAQSLPSSAQIHAETNPGIDNIYKRRLDKAREAMPSHGLVGVRLAVPGVDNNVFVVYPLIDSRSYLLAAMEAAADFYFRDAPSEASYVIWAVKEEISEAARIEVDLNPIDMEE